jgi:hypothetical protein
MSSVEDEAVSRKRKYPTVNALITDGDLCHHVGRYETGAPEVLLTLGTALLRDHDPAPLPAAGLLASLEDNLSVFVPGLSAEKQRDISANLLNGRIQFLNTLSELGLARYYVKLGWCVRLAEPLPAGQKDVDLFMSRSGDVRWLDVVNAAPNEWEGDGFVPPLPNDFETRLVNKVAQKFTSKFPNSNQRWLDWSTLGCTRLHEKRRYRRGCDFARTNPITQAERLCGQGVAPLSRLGGRRILHLPRYQNGSQLGA